MSSKAKMEDNLRERIIQQPDVILEDQDLMHALIAANERAMGGNIVDLRGIAMDRLEARLDRLEQSGVIAGYALRLGQAARPALRATALLQIEPRSGPTVLARLKSLPQVTRVNTTSGRFDLIVEVTARNTEELDETLDRIIEAKGVRSSESLIHLSTKLDRI